MDLEWMRGDSVEDTKEETVWTGKYQETIYSFYKESNRIRIRNIKCSIYIIKT